MRTGTAEDWQKLAPAFATALREAFGIDPLTLPAGDHPALAWKRAGLMDITGLPDGPGLIAPVPLTVLADAALSALRHLSGSTQLPANGALLLGERARMLHLRRRGAISPNGSCRLLACADGHLALNLPRADDWDLASAMVGQPVDDWPALTALIRRHTVDEMLARGRLLGLAVAAARFPRRDTAPFHVHAAGPRELRTGPPLVVDLSALWAGPLAGSLLQLAGARVVKVESISRPDGARRGNPHFFALLNGGKTHLQLDFHQATDRARLQRLVRRADIIIEASRPRALAALGIDAEAEAARGASWLSITGHGREGEAASAIAFGDDAAVAGGVAAHMQRSWGQPLFAGDALADPLTGITAAAAGWASWRGGGGRLISLAMADVVAFACGFGTACEDMTGRWQAMAHTDNAPLYPLRRSLGEIPASCNHRIGESENMHAAGASHG